MNEQKTEWWLAERVGNKLLLVDGPHDKRPAVSRALYLIQNLRAISFGEKYVAVKIEPVTPSDRGVNKRAIETLNNAYDAMKRKEYE